MSRLAEIYNAVQESHPGLARAFLFSLLVERSNQSAMLVGMAGTGKSTVMSGVKSTAKRRVYEFDALTTVGLRYVSKEGFDTNSTIIIDDLSKGGTEYRQITTVVLIGELVFSGQVRLFTKDVQASFVNFKGSALIGAQPLMLRRIISASEFDTDIRDKVIRYYHLYAPQKVNLDSIKVDVDVGYDYDRIGLPADVINSKDCMKAYKNFLIEFSEARAQYHFFRMLQVSAMIDERKLVSELDCRLLKQLTDNFYVEKILFDKRNLEGARRLNVNIIPVITMMSAKGYTTVDELEQRFGVSERRIYEILNELQGYVYVKKKYVRPVDKIRWLVNGMKGELGGELVIE
ncbi:MAG: hypothetical protein ACPL07_01325 [Candidatus Bathyarchaeia archaeon]